MNQDSNFNQLYFFLHMPKCGGSSFSKFLLDHFKHSIYFNGSNIPEDYSKEVWQSVQFVGGHLIPDFKSLIRNDIKVNEFTIMREPISRYISHYNYIKGILNKLDDVYRDVDSLSNWERDLYNHQLNLRERITKKTFDEIVDDELYNGDIINMYLRMLHRPLNTYVGYDWSSLGEEHLKIAIERLNSMSFVGLTENMDGTFLLLCNLLNIKPQKPLVENVTENKIITLNNISPKTLEKIREKLEYDFIIYEHGKKIFNEKLSEISNEYVLKNYLVRNPEVNHGEVIRTLQNNVDSSVPFDREKIVKDCIIDKNSRILEIGPLNRPIVTKREYPNCYYGDIRSTQQVKELYTSNDYLELTGIHINSDEIVDIDYVLKDSYAETFKEDEKFDFIIASHVLEHMEDIIFFLRDVASALKSKGKICILYPDKRYCFDHFRESSSFRDAFDVFTRGRQETARMVFDFYINAISQNSEALFWNGEQMEKYLPSNSTDDAVKAYKNALNGERPDDVHYWPFTDTSFLKFIYDCVHAKLIPFKCVKFHPTCENRQEFFVVLELDNDVVTDNTNELLWLSSLIGSAPLDYNNLKQKRVLEEAKSQIIEKQTQLAKTQSELNSIQMQFTSTQNQLNSTREKLIYTQSQLDNTQVQLSDTQGKLNSTQAQLADTQRELNSTQAQLVDTESELSSTKNILSSAQGDLDSILNSASWRITKPIRATLDTIKKILRK